MGLRRGGAELLLVVGSLVSMVAIAFVGEIAARSFSRVGFLGNSRHLFVADAYGASKGNAPNVEAVSFGALVYTDEYGFRVPKGGVPGDEDRHDAILLLSDSVGFGPGVDEPESFAGLLRARLPERRIYNASVIGYSTPDYRNVVEAFVPAHDEVTGVVLVYCLNDVSAQSAQDIDRYLKAKKEKAPERDIRETLRSFALLSGANEFLRSRSKLYLLLKHRLFATQLRSWKATLSLYGEERASDVERAASDIGEIAAFLEARDTPFLVVLSPFEYQLRKPEDPETQIPQRQLGDLLARKGVESVDARPFFDARVPSADYFLAYDPMHLSAEGHRVVADIIAGALTERAFGKQ
jgi:lysophospholipase L1-like esterase